MLHANHVKFYKDVVWLLMKKRISILNLMSDKSVPFIFVDSEEKPFLASDSNGNISLALP